VRRGAAGLLLQMLREPETATQAIEAGVLTLLVENFEVGAAERRRARPRWPRKAADRAAPCAAARPRRAAPRVAARLNAALPRARPPGLAPRAAASLQRRAPRRLPSFLPPSLSLSSPHPRPAPPPSRSPSRVVCRPRAPRIRIARALGPRRTTSPR
jgi:hypothetical protein